MRARTLEEGRNADDDLNRVAEGRVQQTGERLAEFEGELLGRGAEELDEEINEDGHGVVPFGVDRCEHFER